MRHKDYVSTYYQNAGSILVHRGKAVALSLNDSRIPQELIVKVHTRNFIGIALLLVGLAGFFIFHWAIAVLLLLFGILVHRTVGAFIQNALLQTTLLDADFYYDMCRNQVLYLSSLQGVKVINFSQESYDDDFSLPNH